MFLGRERGRTGCTVPLWIPFWAICPGGPFQGAPVGALVSAPGWPRCAYMGAHGCAYGCRHMRSYVRSHIRAHAGACGHTGAGMRTCVQGRGPPGVLPPIACTLLKTHPLFKKIPYFRPFFLGWPGSCNINYSYIEYY